jgi:hypothetical protein
MADTLTQLVAKVQAALLDTGTSYTLATITAAVRQALKDYNQVAPNQAGTLMDAVSGQYEYVLNANDFATLLNVLGIWYDNGNDIETPLTFTHYWEDNVPVIRLDKPQNTATAKLIVRYTAQNTVNGLDGSTDSSLPAYCDQVLVMGSAYYAICIRQAGRVEPINLNQDVPKNLREAAAAFRSSFLTGLSEIKSRPTRKSDSNPTWTFDPKV